MLTVWAASNANVMKMAHKLQNATARIIKGNYDCVSVRGENLVKKKLKVPKEWHYRIFAKLWQIKSSNTFDFAFHNFSIQKYYQLTKTLDAH